MFGLSFALLLSAGLCFGLPPYRVWQKEKAGQAQLRQAQWNRQIAIEEANARMLSATKLAAADTIRAHGVARSNEIIGTSLRGNWEYLQWLAIENLKETNAELIYVPHEMGMPLPESGREAIRDLRREAAPATQSP